MKISIVIPVYNEADRLAACLQAIANQKAPAYEVIVVDNNSTDGTATIAARYSFLRLLHEPRQGVVHARNRGFNAAKGEVIARLDADTLLPVNWTTQVQAIFKDPTVGAVSGAPHYYDFALSGVADAMDLYFREGLARRLGKANFLWGANMAVRRSAWLEVRSGLCGHHRMHEDFDLGIHLQSQGHKVIYDENLVAGVSSRRIDSGLVDYICYTLVSPRTYRLHRLRQRFHMYPVLAVCWFFYVPGRLIYRAYNPATGSFSLTQILTLDTARVDPSSNII